MARNQMDISPTLVEKVSLFARQRRYGEIDMAEE